MLTTSPESHTSQLRSDRMHPRSDQRVVPTPVTVQNLSCFVSSKNWCQGTQKPILHSAYAEFLPGTITGIVGGSGHGKSTLLNAMAGRFNGRTTGNVLYGGQILSPKQMTRVVSFTMASEDYFSYTTCYETLMSVAMLNLPTLSAAEVADLVEDILKHFNLTSCRDTYLSGFWKSTMSLGEKRRLAVACAFLNDRSVMVLDEPTSGVDVFTEVNMISLMKEEARHRNRTVIASLHQLTSQSFALLDQLVLMSSGRIVFAGPASQAVAYFTNLGYTCQPDWNPADFLMDVLMFSGKPSLVPSESPPPSSLGTPPNMQQVVRSPPSLLPPRSFEFFAEAWQASPSHQAIKSRLDFQYENGSTVPPSETLPTPATFASPSSVTPFAGSSASEPANHRIVKPHSGFLLSQICILTRRSFLHSVRNPLSILIMLIIQAIQASLFGILLAPQTAGTAHEPLVPLISPRLEETNQWIQYYLNGIGPNHHQPLASLFVNGIGPNQSYIYFNRDNTTDQIHNFTNQMIQGYSTCLYTALDLPSRGFVAIKSQYEPPATLWEDWTHSQIFGNFLGLFQAIRYKFVDAEGDDKFSPDRIQGCISQYPGDYSMPQYQCILGQIRHVVDVFLECAKLPGLPDLSYPLNETFIPTPAPPLPTSEPVWDPEVYSEVNLAWVDLYVLEFARALLDFDEQGDRDLVAALDNLRSTILRLTYPATYTGRVLNLAYKAVYHTVQVLYETGSRVLRIGGCLFFVAILIGFATYGALLAAHSERVIFNRETRNGTYHPLSYFIAKNLADLPLQLLPPLLLVTIFFFTVGILSSWTQVVILYTICILTVICADGVGYCFSAMSPRLEAAVVIAPMVFVIWLLLSGLLLRDADVYWAINWIKFTSPYRYAYFSLVINQFPDGQFFAGLPNRFILSLLGVTQTSLVFNLSMLVIFAVAVRVMTYAFLVKAYRHVGLEM